MAVVGVTAVVGCGTYVLLASRGRCADMLGDDLGEGKGAWASVRRTGGVWVKRGGGGREVRRCGRYVTCGT
ncbi:hypothetical protein CP973_04505 [Streptomyces albofaciens JCM 4342]|nr:hypothetical protein CP973_04505 [Streptomyces albofaciens JCM 4342]